MQTRTDYRIAAGIILLHTIMLGVGSQILAGAFEFPEVLRRPAEYRLNLFLANRAVIIPTYYLMALTGITQLTIAVLLHQCFARRDSTVLVLATVFGVLSGAWQVMGFLRWSVLIPYVAEAMVQADAAGLRPETVAFVEAVANRYIGMAVGEHLGFLGQVVWTVLLAVAMLRSRLFERRLGWTGLVLGVLTIPVCLEPLGGPFTAFAAWAMPVVTAWVVWLLVLAFSLVRTDAVAGTGPRLGWKTAAAAAGIYAAFVVPALG